MVQGSQAGRLTTSGPAPPQRPVYLVLASALPAVSAQFLPRGAPQRPVPWLYLGRDYHLMQEWRLRLGPGFSRVEYGEELQALAMRFRRPYLNWVASLGEQHASLEWWTSYAAERNTLSDGLFHAVCYLGIGLAETQRTLGPLLVMAESPAVLRSLATRPELAARVRWPGRVLLALVRMQRLAGLVGRWLWYVLDAAGALADARATRTEEAIPPAATENPRVLIHTCLDDSYFGEDKEPKDRYFTVLPEELRRLGYDVVTMPWLYNLRRSRRAAFAWFRRHPGRFLIPEDFYSPVDYLWAAWRVVRGAEVLRGSHAFQGMDITLLVEEARGQQRAAIGTARFLRYMRLVRRLKERGFRIDVWIDLFENMVAEKPQLLALRKLMPRVKTVGFQHYLAPAPLHLFAFTTPREAAIAPHPDVIVCNSPFTVRLLAQEGFPPEKLRVGPSLRYLHVEGPTATSAREPGAVLVVLPLEEWAATEVLGKLAAAFPGADALRFWVKPHPMMRDRERRRLWRRPGPTPMEVVDGTVSQWLAKAMAAVTAASTSALEMVLASVPVVQVGRETDFNMDPLAWFSEFPRPVYGVEQLRHAVLSSVALPDSERQRLQAWARQMRSQLISPLTDTTVKAFLPGSSIALADVKR